MYAFFVKLYKRTLLRQGGKKPYFFPYADQPTAFEKFSSSENTSNAVQRQKKIVIWSVFGRLHERSLQSQFNSQSTNVQHSCH